VKARRPENRRRAVQQLRCAMDRGVNYLDTAWPYHKAKLERNTSEKLLRRTKLTLSEQFSVVAGALKNVLPQLTRERFYDFFIVHQALLAGGWPLGQPTDLQRRVVRELGLHQA